MEKVEVIGKTVVKMWTTEFDETARKQIENLASLPFVHHHIALMPRCRGTGPCHQLSYSFTVSGYKDNFEDAKGRPLDIKTLSIW